MTTKNSKIKDLEPVVVDDDGSRMTTNEGFHVYDTDNTLRCGKRGPATMRDVVFFEKMQHFDRERIPERVVHARGSSAHGYFEAYDDFSKYTRACVFSKKGKQTPVLTRFSLVGASRGGPDNYRDVRGFAVKFYTDEGNWDLVGNNVPVFFIQDGIKFPDLIHAVKPEPVTDVPQGQTAHDSFYDFVSTQTEASHMLMWVLSDRTLPRSFVHMQGFGVHTFILRNAKGEPIYAKFHWIPKLGVRGTTWEEATTIRGGDPDFQKKDLWDRIASGSYPEWELGVQLISEEMAFTFNFDLLDSTKIVPTEICPLTMFGKLVLNANPWNSFSENEQVGFCPANMIPGVEPSNDPLLTSRLMSYKDTLVYRLGTNYQQLPINRPICPFANNQRDGSMLYLIKKHRTNYSPNTVSQDCPKPGIRAGDDRNCPPKPSAYDAQEWDVELTKARGHFFDDHFTQARMFYTSLQPWEQNHIMEAAIFEMNKCTDRKVVKNVIYNNLNHIDPHLAQQVAQGCFITPPPPLDKYDNPSSYKSVSLADYERPRIDGLVCAILLNNGFPDALLKELQTAIKGAKGICQLVADVRGPIVSDEQYEYEADHTYDSIREAMFDFVYVLGSEKDQEGLENARFTTHVWLTDAYRHSKPIGGGPDSVVAFKAAGIDMEAEGVVINSIPKFLEACHLVRFWNRVQVPPHKADPTQANFPV